MEKCDYALLCATGSTVLQRPYESSYHSQTWIEYFRVGCLFSIGCAGNLWEIGDGCKIENAKSIENTSNRKSAQNSLINGRVTKRIVKENLLDLMKQNSDKHNTSLYFAPMIHGGSTNAPNDCN